MEIKSIDPCMGPCMGAYEVLSILASSHRRGSPSYWEDSTWKNMCIVFRDKRIVSTLPSTQICIKFANLYHMILIYSGLVDNDKIESYSINREKFISKGKGSDFKMAVKHMDEYLSNPMV